MIVKSVVTSIIYSGGKRGTGLLKTDPSFIGPEFARCDVKWDVVDEEYSWRIF